MRLDISGGATNPFVSLYLLPLMIAATVLPARYTWAMAGMTAAAYSMLMVWYRLDRIMRTTRMSSGCTCWGCGSTSSRARC